VGKRHIAQVRNKSNNGVYIVVIRQLKRRPNIKKLKDKMKRLIKTISIAKVKDGHTTTDRPNLKAKQVIDHYNWNWSEMTPTKGRIKVIDFDNYLK
jgi:hypothetical protein